MTFLNEIKEQIISQPYKNPCCKRAMLDAILLTKGKCVMADVEISISPDVPSEFITSLIKDCFGKDADISVSPNGGRARIYRFHSPAAERSFSALADKGDSFFVPRCQSCESAFLRGVILACARITDPTKRYRFELAPTNSHHLLAAFLSNLGLNFSETERRGEHIIYTGNSSIIEDFFAAAGMNSTAFTLMNAKIESEFKNAANRIRNCEMNNIIKTVSAAGKVINAIEALDRANLLSSLPEDLEKTARLRLQFQDYSLARLAAEFTPPISKPGLSHRLNKIVELSERLVGNSEE